MTAGPWGPYNDPVKSTSYSACLLHTAPFAQSKLRSNQIRPENKRMDLFAPKYGSPNARASRRSCGWDQIIPCGLVHDNGGTEPEKKLE